MEEPRRTVCIGPIIGKHNRSNKVLGASCPGNVGVPACPHYLPVLLVTSRRGRLRSKHVGAHFLVSRVITTLIATLLTGESFDGTCTGVEYPPIAQVT